jgi:hypothetical protein
MIIEQDNVFTRWHLAHGPASGRVDPEQDPRTGAGRQDRTATCVIMEIELEEDELPGPVALQHCFQCGVTRRAGVVRPDHERCATRVAIIARRERRDFLADAGATASDGIGDWLALLGRCGQRKDHYGEHEGCKNAHPDLGA